MRLTKHHGLGNDFLVLLDPNGDTPVDVATVRAACDRHRGVGADGFIRVTRGGDGSDVSMELHNADGGRAEMSGNGIGCLAQAVALAGWVTGGRLTVATDAGRRTVEVQPGSRPRTHLTRTAMGPVRVGLDEPEWLDDDIIRAVHVDVGNPHLVLHAPDPDTKYDLAERGRHINEVVPGGVNVEVITVGPNDGELTMSVYERGVGLTQACGTGACAAAAAAHAWDLVGEQVRVLMPGGPTVVELGPDVRLTTPTVFVATVEFHWP